MQLGALVAHAAQEGATMSLHHPHHVQDSFIEFARLTAIGIGILIPALIAGAYLLGSRRLLGNQALGIISFATLCLLPLFLVAVGSFATFEEAKSVAFCHSCHAPMDMYVTDMKDPDSESLAALHYKNRYIQDDQCYTCHADYGVFGTAEAKFTGLYHMIEWVRGSEAGRGDKQIELYSPYQNQLCLRCHAGSQKFLDADDGTHVDMEESLLATDPDEVLSCLDCHAPAHVSFEEWKADGAS